jgi:hypothetical protein
MNLSTLNSSAPDLYHRTPHPVGARTRGGCLRVLLFLITAIIVWVPPIQAQTIQVDATPSHATNSFRPQRALGAGIDRLRRADVEKIFTQPVLNEMLSAGWLPVTYRQNTELKVEAWHWNPKGQWSDPRGQGYFTGDGTPSGELRFSTAYPLPHRGFTRNAGTEEHGFSRLNDGVPTSYWKSNPYLTQAFTGEDDSSHPQWILVDLGSEKEVDAIRIAWGEPYAVSYQVQYWTGENAVELPAKGEWRTFPSGTITVGRGGTVTHKLVTSAVTVRYLRVLMTHSSNTCDTHGSDDRRNCVGYAINEVYVGRLDRDGRFQDYVRHSADQSQTVTFCSSVDPWHSSSDLDEPSGGHVGFDLFYHSGITRGLPAMVPVAMVYGTPEDAAAEMEYLKKRGYPVSYVEMGEEPDGQNMLPEDYGALYLQFAAAIHRVDPNLKLGGPVFTGVNEDIQVWPDAQGRTSWLGRFIDYLKKHRRLADLSFVSFEHYPYEPCGVTWASLYEEPRLISHIIQVWREDGAPRDVPMFVTEANIAWQTSESFVGIFGALWLADFTGAALTAGLNGVYYYEYVPREISPGCNNSYGNFSMFRADVNFQTKQRLSQFFASQLITKEWVKPSDEIHQTYPASSDLKDSEGHALVTAYALFRPDGQWALLVVNKDRDHPHETGIAFYDSDTNAHRSFAGPISMITFGSAQYRWHANGRNGYAAPDGPAVGSTVISGPTTRYTLPAASVTVLRGEVR